MLLKLRNFRCHKEATFEIPDSGLVLLSGNSGSGKSTILKAIVYALFGKIQKPYSFGTNACSVYLEFMGMNITRSNRPNRLIVNDRYEDDAAQEYIIKRLGMNQEEFNLSSYIPQKANESLLSMTQLNQLNYLKLLSFNGNENEKHKERLNKMISETSDKMIEYRTELKTYGNEMVKLEEDIEPIEFPLHKEDGETEDESIDRYKSRMATFNKRLSELIDSKEKQTHKLQEYLLLKADMEMYMDKQRHTEIQIENKRNQYNEVHTKLLEDNELDFDIEITKLEHFIAYTQLKHDITELQEQYDKILEEETKEKKKELLHIKKTLWMFKGQLKPIEEVEMDIEKYNLELHQWHEYQNELNKYEEVRNEIDTNINEPNELLDYVKEIIHKSKKEIEKLEYSKELIQKMKQQADFEKQLLNCPICETDLKLQNNELVEVKDVLHIEQRDYDTEIDDIQANITQQHEIIDKYNEYKHKLTIIQIPVLDNTDEEYYNTIENELKVLNKFLEKNKVQEEYVRNIEQQMKTGNLSPALKTMNDKVKEKKRQLTSHIDYFEKEDIIFSKENRTLDELTEYKTQLIERRQAHNTHQLFYKEITKQLRELEEELTKCNTRLEIITNKMTGTNGDAIKRRLTDIDIQMTKARRKQLEDESLLDRVDKYLEYCDLKKKYEYWEHKYETISLKLNEVQQRYNSYVLLKEKYIQAEVMALDSTMHTINEHTKHFLDTFFIDIPITAKLHSINKNKKLNTLKLSTYINYKGNEYDNINQLSGGELDRCNLASICGVNSMLNSPILILDESLASLDADTNTDILSFLKDMGQDKLILVCSHEAVRGIFDTVVELK